MSTKKKILVIEDSMTVGQMLQSLLEDEGYEVIIAENGERGVESTKADKPDLVIIDTVLPGIDGCQTCQQIKASADYAVKVIVITGNVNAVDAGKARKAGADAYCVKTSDFSLLLETIKETL